MPAHLDWNWELEIKFKPQELEEAYELYFFLGPVPSSPSNWRDSPSRLFEPITSREETEHTEYRYLNGYLEDRCEGKLEDDDVVPYLRKHLSWRIKKVRPTERRPAEPYFNPALPRQEDRQLKTQVTEADSVYAKWRHYT